MGTGTWTWGVQRLPRQADLPGPVVWGPGPRSSPGCWPPPQPQQLDPENTGFIGADTFTGLVHRHELPLDPAKLDMLVALAQSNERGQVCSQELVDLVSVLWAGSWGGGPAWHVQSLGWSGVGRWPLLPALSTGEGCGHRAEPGTL